MAGLSFTDQQYNAEGMWSMTTTYPLGMKVVFQGRLYESLVGSNINNTPNTATAFWRDCGIEPTDGYYQHILLSDLVNNFMIQETSDGMMLDNVKRTLVEYHAQRGLQELSYDTLRTVKSFSVTLDGSISFRIPQDAVGIIGIYWADELGYKHLMQERIQSGNPEQPLLDSDGNPMYDSEGNQLLAERSDLVANFNRRRESIGADAFYNYYAGSFENDELYDRYYSYYGRRFGSEPSETNINGTYIFDEEEGTVYIEENFADSDIIIDYVSDGLGNDIDKIRVHKFAEDAIYEYIKSKIISSMRDAPLYEKRLAQKMASNSKRRAKHRMSSISPKEIYQTILNKQKWIKR